MSSSTPDDQLACGSVQSLDLGQIRQQIDHLDAQLQTLINRRAKLAEAVARAKLNDPATAQGSAVFYRPEREAQVLRNVMARNQGPLSDETMARLFREIMSACLALEAPQSIAFLGPQGTYTHAAVLKHFGKDAVIRPITTIDEVFREVESGSAHYGVVPVENSSEGIVNHTLDCFRVSGLHVIGEVELPIHHQFLISKNTRKDSIKQIYAHQQALAQCRQWLDSHYPGVERVALSSNAEAARRIQNEWHSAAIAGDVAAQIYDLEILHANIEDHPDNTTRFLVIGREKAAPSGHDKTSLLISAHDKSGALLEILTPLARHGITMTSIETRPASPEKWAYVFFIDIKGHIDDANVQQALDEMRPQVKELRVLGSYPQAVI